MMQPYEIVLLISGLKSLLVLWNFEGFYANTEGRVCMT